MKLEITKDEVWSFFDTLTHFGGLLFYALLLVQGISWLIHHVRIVP